MLNDEVLPKPYPTAEEAHAEGRQLAAAFEAEHGRPADWFIAATPAPH